MYKAEILRGSREREKKLKNTKRLFGVLLMVIIVGAFLVLVNLNFFRVTGFNLVGQTSQDLALVKSTIRSELNGYCFFIVPNNSVFFFSKTRLINLLKLRFPGLQTVEINSPDLNTLTIKFVDRESKVLWCSTSKSGKLCFYLNDEGQVYQTAPNFSDSIVMEFNSELVIKKLPSQVIDPQDLERAKVFLNFTKSTLVDWPTPKSNYRLVQINILPAKDFEAIIASAIDPDKSWKIIFNTGTNSDQLITNFNSLVKDPTLTKDWDTAKSLDYLDFRFDNKVFYRFK
jgi:hypothetical protein